MDPHAALQSILDMLAYSPEEREKEREAILERLEGLTEWIKKDGFLPGLSMAPQLIPDTK